MNKIKERRLGVGVNLALMIGALIFGFCYPDLFNDTLEELLWHGEDGDLFIFGLIGALAFEFSGVALTGIIKYLLNNNLKKSSSVAIIVDFLAFGGAYMTIRIMSYIEDYGVIGKVAIEQNGLEVAKPIAIIILILSIIVLVAHIYMFFFCTRENTDNKTLKSLFDKFSDIIDIEKYKAKEVQKTTEVHRDTDAGKSIDTSIDGKENEDIFSTLKREDADKIMKELFGNADDGAENMMKTSGDAGKESDTEKLSGRIKSTMRTSANVENNTESERFKPAGDL